MWRSREMLHVCQRPTRLPEQLPGGMPSKRRKQYDNNACRIVLETGDTVLVQNVSEWGGPGKLRSYWEKFMKFLLSLGKIGQTPLYTKCESGTKKRVLHCNVLLPYTYLQVDKADVRPRDKDNVRQQNQNASSRHSKHFNRKTCIASQAIKDEDIPSFTNAHSSNTVDHPVTGEFSTHIT